MKNKRKILWLVLTLLLLLLSACASATRQSDGGGIVGEIVYNRVYNGTLDAWQTASIVNPLLWAAFWFILIAAIGLGLGLLTENEGTGLTIGVVVGVIVACIAIFWVGYRMHDEIPKAAENQAINAVKVGIDQAKFDKANVYLEELHVPIVAVFPPGQNLPEARKCEEAIDQRSNCGAYEWTTPCCPHKCNCQDICTSRDKDGHCTSSYESCQTCYRTKHIPYFTELWRYTVYARMMTKLATAETGLSPYPSEDGIVFRNLSDWMVPVDYNAYWRGNEQCSLNPSDYTPPADWQRYHDMVSVGQVPLVNVPHKYVNWINAAEASMYMEYAGNIPQYQAAGLLPAMNPIYSRLGVGWAADYDFVQFVGGINVTGAEYYRWQDPLSVFSAYFSNARQGSLVVVFAPKDKVESLGSVDAWAKTIKANFQQKGKWDEIVNGESLQRLMPKNVFILACVVDVANNTIPANGCRIESGMPQGNEGIKDTLVMGTDPALKDIPFTPEGFVGNVSITYTPKEGSAFPDVALTRDPGRPMDLLLRDDPMGLRRVSMKGFDYLQADIKLSAEDINALVAKEVQVQQSAAGRSTTSAFLWLVGLMVLLCAVFFGPRFLSS